MIDSVELEVLPDGSRPVLRSARAEDLHGIVALLQDDELGRGRERIEGDVLPEGYGRAFASIDADPTTLLLVVLLGERLVGTFQLNFLTGLSHQGSTRAQIESVRVAADLRSLGIGRRMMDWAIAEARRRGCRLVQLTTDKSRGDAHRFYLGLGFVASHEGMKLRL